jgi:hypothetical protein
MMYHSTVMHGQPHTPSNHDACAHATCQQCCVLLAALHSLRGLQFRDFVDGPRGLMAEGLKATRAQLPPHLAKAFAYLLPHAAAARSDRSSRRSRRGSVASKSQRSAGSVAGDLSDFDADVDAAAATGDA